MLTELPKAWRSAIIAILRRGTSGREIIVLQSVRNDWFALTSNPYAYSLFDALVGALQREGRQGRPSPDMRPPGETYEFVFDYAADHGTVQVYAKLNLQPGGKLVIIHSAHRPRKNDELTA